MEQVFISHSSDDKGFVEGDLMPLLRAYSITPWYSAEDIPSAAMWERMIRKGLESSNWFAVVLSPHANASQWVQAEVAWAIDNRTDRIVPILIADCTPSDVHLRLIHYQYVDFRSNTDQAKRDLLAIWGKRLADISMLELSIAIGHSGSEDNVQQRTLLISDGISIGRSPECEIFVCSQFVSRRHAYIKTSKQDDSLCLLLYDLATRASTKVNGSVVDRAWRLSCGDVIEIADVSIVVKGIRKME